MNPAMAVHRSKDRTFSDAGNRQPGFQGGDRTPSSPGERYPNFLPASLLVGFRPKEVQDDALSGMLDVAAI
ncbi:hypothetical protein [Bradyrhizobium sp. 6(2017)]|uniref:hypothetical protein n=1 Tax=Bradyrhizobium sp. 6(2017) TaxID=1197460 RepID=UPI0013E0F4F9|nr:hypothetical protein [Bradyrhizobium sp. 6(2017)]QIG96580.1 hypothetical protein G6P99_32040 [Bradyrhizobium sp. 6(2017)]